LHARQHSACYSTSLEAALGTLPLGLHPKGAELSAVLSPREHADVPVRPSLTARDLTRRGAELSRVLISYPRSV
jgi:hypothetical protein